MMIPPGILQKTWEAKKKANAAVLGTLQGLMTGMGQAAGGKEPASTATGGGAGQEVRQRPGTTDQSYASRALGVLAVATIALVLAGTLAAVNWGGARRGQEQSVKPGINTQWKSRDVDPLIQTLESESREIYHQREKLATLVGLKPGMDVADVGAGSGFMVELFAKQVGLRGKVYAVDINPVLLGRIARRARDAGLINVRTVVTPEDAVDLPQRSVDVVFLCDTYHHFEYPKGSLRGIRRALRRNGELVVVEFQRVPGRSPEWLLNHVRADKETFTREIAKAGFKLVREEPAPFLMENYVLRFQKRGN